MSKKRVIWITGSGGSGKTTQSKKLIEFLKERDDEPALISNNMYSPKQPLEYCYTLYKESRLAVLGKLGPNQCTGLDSVYSKIGASGVQESLQMALNNGAVDIIVMECLFGTFSWYENWVKAGIRDDFELIFIHLEMDLWHNYRRIQKRRWKKDSSKLQNDGITDYRDVPLEDTVYKNVGNKNRETRVVYEKIAGKHEKSKVQLADKIIQLDANMDENLIFNAIVNLVAE